MRDNFYKLKLQFNNGKDEHNWFEWPWKRGKIVKIIQIEISEWGCYWPYKQGFLIRNCIGVSPRQKRCRNSEATVWRVSTVSGRVHTMR